MRVVERAFVKPEPQFYDQPQLHTTSLVVLKALLAWRVAFLALKCLAPTACSVVIHVSQECSQ